MLLLGYPIVMPATPTLRCNRQPKAAKRANRVAAAVELVRFNREVVGLLSGRSVDLARRMQKISSGIASGEALDEAFALREKYSEACRYP